jgi:hypothetical protein
VIIFPVRYRALSIRQSRHRQLRQAHRPDRPGDHLAAVAVVAAAAAGNQRNYKIRSYTTVFKILRGRSHLGRMLAKV